MDELIEQAAILRVLVRLCRGMDRVDGDMIESCYWPEAIDDHGGFVGPGHEFAHKSSRTSPENVSAHHSLGQSLIEVNGDTAVSETYFDYTAVRQFEDTGATWAEVHGRYLDRFEKRDGEWRVIYRKVVHDVAKEEPLPTLFREAEKLTAAERYPDDYSYGLDDSHGRGGSDFARP